MEIVIPPRDHHAQSTYRYTWDDNGEVTQVQRLSESLEDQHDQERRPRVGRQTVQWPFQSIATDTDISSPTTEHFRRATWQGRGLGKVGKDSDSIDEVDRSIVPDYVVNFIRGETPETLAKKKRHGGRIGERDVDILHQHRPHRSRAAEFEGFYDDEMSRSGTAASHDEARMLPGSNEKPTRREWRRLWHGWRVVVLLNVALSFLIMLIGLVCLIIAVAKKHISAGESTIFTGSCSTASNINWGLHALVNVFAVALIAGGNYAFQVLSSPTRAEVDRAHSRKNWLDIGIPSLRNFAHISSGRAFLAVIILVVAIISQVIYNAVIFTSRTDVDFNLVFVTPSFLTGSPFSNATAINEGGLSRLDLLGLQDLASRNQLVNFTTSDCIAQFNSISEPEFRAVLLITDMDSASSSLLQTTISGTPITPFVNLDGASPQLTLVGSAVQYCLAQAIDRSTDTCAVLLNGSLLGVATLLNLITVAITAGVVFIKWPSQPLATLGDAIASFLLEPDPSTRDNCLLSKTDVWQGRWGIKEAKYWVPHDHYWFRTSSLPRWLCTTFPWLAFAALAAAALGISSRATATGKLSSFGYVDAQGLYTLSPSFPASGAALIASLPQVLVCTLYLAINSLLTTFYLSHESSLYATGQSRPLRVSANPQGQQIASLYITLPRPISWLLFVLFAAMAFVVSQSVLVSSVQFSAPRPGADSLGLVALGFSGVGLVVVLVFLVSLAVLVLGLACRRAPPAVMVNGQAIGNPLVLEAGSCSAVIAARCHRVPTEIDVWKWPVSFGVVYDGLGMEHGHCTYSMRGVGQLDMTKSYA